MDELILDIMSQAIRINNDKTLKAAVEFEFLPSTKILKIIIFVNGKFGHGLTKTWSVDTTDKDSLDIVKKDLDNAELPKIEDDFLG